MAVTLDMRSNRFVSQTRKPDARQRAEKLGCAPFDVVRTSGFRFRSW